MPYPISTSQQTVTVAWCYSARLLIQRARVGICREVYTFSSMSDIGMNSDIFQSDIFVSDIGITDVDVGYRISLTLRSMSIPIYGVD
jgi:hypothetical protein